MLNKLKPWLAWGVAAFFGLYQFLIQGSPSVMISGLSSDLNLSLVQIGFLTSSFFYTYIVLQVPAGMIIDLFGPRRTLIVGMSLCAIAAIYFGLATTPTQATASRLFMGIMSAPAIVAALCLASRWFRAEHFVLIVGLTEMIALLGGAIGEGLLAKIVVDFGWRKTMVFVGISGLILFFLTLLFVHDFPVKPQKTAKRNFNTILYESKKSFLTIIKIPQIWINGIFAGFAFGLYPAFAALWSVPYLKARYLIEVDVAASISSMFFIGGAIGSLLLGWLSIYIPKKQMLMTIGTVLTLVFCVIIFYGPNISLNSMYIYFLIFGFVSCTYSLAFTLAEKQTPVGSKGVVMGLINLLCLIVGAPILQPLIGYLIKHHDFNIAMICFPISLTVALILSFFIKNEKPQTQITT